MQQLKLDSVGNTALWASMVKPVQTSRMLVKLALARHRYLTLPDTIGPQFCEVIATSIACFIAKNLRPVCFWMYHCNLLHSVFFYILSLSTEIMCWHWRGLCSVHCEVNQLLSSSVLNTSLIVYHRCDFVHWWLLGRRGYRRSRTSSSERSNANRSSLSVRPCSWRSRWQDSCSSDPEWDNSCFFLFFFHKQKTCFAAGGPPFQPTTGLSKFSGGNPDVNNIMLELDCHIKKSGNVQTGDRDDANSVQEFGDCVGDKHSFR